MDAITLKDFDRFLNRELSWLKFNERVLAEAQNPANPLFERLRFLSITDSNLKEFYMVRVAGLKGQVAAGINVPSRDGLTPAEQLKSIRREVISFMGAQSGVWGKLKKELAKKDVHLLVYDDLTSKDKAWLTTHFKEQIFPLLTPLAVDPAHPFPFVPNFGFVMALDLKNIKTGQPQMALLPLPARKNRFVRLPGEGQRHMLLEEVVQHFMNQIFPGFRVEDQGLFNIIRDSEVAIQEDAEDLVRSFETALKKRRRGSVSRLTFIKGTSARVKDFVIAKLGAEPDYIYEREGMLSLIDVSQLITGARPNLLYPHYSPRMPERLREFNGDCFFAIKDKDFIVHHPYESFDVVAEFLQQAARDPNVLTIKQTLYRTTEDSPIVRALVEAAESGKSVTALIELAARFDEEANIRLARQMERAGVQVVYGIQGLKTHVKMSYIVRREENGLQTYVHYGTGNYHPVNAKVYTDLSFFTCDRALCRDAARLFNYLTGYATPKKVEALAYSPKQMRHKLLQLIEAEIKHVKAGKKGQIWGKMNALLDSKIIDALYKASQAGVKIELVVRGICGLRPGVKGLSENIAVKSIVGRYLEHARIFCFGAGHGLPAEHAKVFISSADWMPRNFNWRVEAMVPITNPTVHQQVLDQIMVANLIDNTNSWQLKSDGTYQKISTGAKAFSAHQYFMENPSLSGRGKSGKTKRLPPKLKLTVDDL